MARKPLNIHKQKFCLQFSFSLNNNSFSPFSSFVLFCFLSLSLISTIFFLFNGKVFPPKNVETKKRSLWESEQKSTWRMLVKEWWFYNAFKVWCDKGVVSLLWGWKMKDFIRFLVSTTRVWNFSDVSYTKFWKLEIWLNHQGNSF